MPVHLFDAAHGYHFDIEFCSGKRFLVVFADEDALEPEFLGFGYPLFDTVDRTDLPTEANFAGKTHPGRERRIFIGAQQGTEDGEVDGRVFYFESACDVQKDIFHAKMKTTSFFEYREQQLETAEIETAHRSLRCSVYGLRHQGLYFDQQRAKPFYRGGDGDAAQRFFFLRDQQLAGVAHAAHALLRHFIDAQFRRAAKTIFQGPKDAVGIMPVAFELKDRVDHVLQHFWACDASVFGNMSYKEHGSMRLFGKTLKFGRAFPDLGDASRGRLDVWRLQGLDRIDDHQLRA